MYHGYLRDRLCLSAENVTVGWRTEVWKFVEGVKEAGSQVRSA